MVKHLALLAFASLALTACKPDAAPIQPGNSAVTSTGVAAGTVIDEKALYAAETAYNVPAHAYVTADANGKLTPELKAKAKPLLLNAYKALKLARAAYKVGDASGFYAQVAAVKRLANEATAILPKAS